MNSWNYSSPGELVLRRTSLLFVLVCCLVFGCTPTATQVAIAPTDTLPGAVVPTRAPTMSAETTDIAALPSETPTEAAASAEPSNTHSPVTQLANVPTDAPTHTVVPPTDSPTDEPTDTAAPPTDAPTDEPSATPPPTSKPTEATAPTDTPTDSPTNTPTDAPTDTPVPTDTPQPTHTPTDTPAPTNTPAPTAASDNSSRYTDSTAFLPVSLEAEIAAFSAVTGTVDDANPARLYVYQGVAGEVLNIAMHSTNDSLDPSLLVIDPKGRELVRNEDESNDSFDAAINGFQIAESGAYVIVATRYGQQFGFSSGGFELTVTKGSGSTIPSGTFSRVIAYNSETTGSITHELASHVYSFRGSRGDVVSIQMTAESGDLDARLFLTDNLGNTLAYNDDDLVNLSINSLIQNFILPASGYYSIIASHYLGAPNSGDFRLSLTLEESGVRDRLLAVLNLENSRTLRADGQYFSNYSAGDSLGEDGSEYRTEALLTFFLPPLPEDTSLSSAVLELAPCYETGNGFAALGALTIYADSYGLLNQNRDFTRPTGGSQILTEARGCDSLDITDMTRNAYSGDSQIQLRISFRDTTANRQGDEILFTPRLVLNLSE